jgi:siroheme synthase-like protein
MSLLLDLQSSFGRALVVGGGGVAARKVRNLAEAEFEITVVALTVLDEIRLAPYVTIHERAWSESDLDGHALVFACTNDRDANRLIGEAARRRGLLVLVADAQGESTFFTPAVIRDGELQVAVSTGGASPTLAKELRTRIAEALGPGWGAVTGWARREREARHAGGAPRVQMTRDEYEAMVRRVLEPPERLP